MKKIVGIICLVVAASVVSVVGMTLAFCMADDPALFHAVTGAAAQSVRDAAGAAGDKVGSALSAAGSGVTSAAGAVGQLFTRTTVLEPVSEGRVQPLTAKLSALDGDTAFVTSGGRETLTGGRPLVYFGQKDPAWAERSYGGDPIGVYGCGPVSMAIVVSSLTGNVVDPAQMADKCVEYGYHAERSGSYLSIIEGICKAYGLTCRSLDPSDAGALTAALDNGGIAVALMGPGSFTQSGQFLLFHGVTAQGELLVADPLSRDNCLVPWDMQLLLGELSDHTSAGAPLWIVTA